MLTTGLHPNVPDEVYRKDPGLNASVIKHGIGDGGSLAAMRWAMDNPKPPTDAMDMGTLLHALVLEPDTFPSRVAVWDGGDRRGKAYTEFAEANLGRIIIKPDQSTALARMRDSIMDHPHARALITGRGMREATAIFNTNAGVRGKARIDFLNTDANVLVDLKTARSCDPRAWARTAVQLKYDVQEAWYRLAFWVVTGKQPDMAFVVVENCDRHRCRVFTLPPDPINACTDAIAALLPKWREALDSGEYPDLPINDPTEIEWPAWAVRGGLVEVMSDDDVPF